jgi:hypothetical protein
MEQSSPAKSSSTRHLGVLRALGAADASLVADEMRYCPTQLLSAFALLMAGHGRAVCTSMMIGDREYAMLQLARAHTMTDPRLREIAAQLFAYFDDERAPAPVGLRA